MTKQIGDLIYYQDKAYRMASKLPVYGSDFEKYAIRFLMRSSHCWRGYEAQWDVEGDKLYLVQVSGRAFVTDLVKYREEKRRLRTLLKQGMITPKENGQMLKTLRTGLTEQRDIDLPFLFNTSDPVHAVWIDGTIYIPNGHIIEYINRGYDFEKDISLTFSKGILVEAKTQIERFFLPEPSPPD